MIAQRPAPPAPPRAPELTRAPVVAPAPVPLLAGRPGYDPSPAVAEARIRRLLETEPVIWLSTIRRDGLPGLVPTWFWWDGEAITVFSKPEAAKVANVRANPRLMVALGHPEDDFDVGLIEAEAIVCRDLVEVPAGFLAKYADRLAEGRLDMDSFRAVYSQAIRIVPRRYLGWHGRGPRHDRHAPASRARRWLAGARTRIVSLRRPRFPRVAPEASPAIPTAHAVTRPVERASQASRLPSWA